MGKPSLDFEVRRFTRRCAVSDRPLTPGETYYSALVDGPEGVTRKDYAGAAWSGPPDNALGWWRARLPAAGNGRQPTPGSALVALLHRWADEPAKAEQRYVLALLLLRRRVVRLDETADLFQPDDEPSQNTAEWLAIVAGEERQRLRVRVARPPAERIAAIDQELNALLYGVRDDPSRPAA